MKKSKAQMKKDGVLALSILLGGIASAVAIKKVPSRFTAPAVAAVGLGGGLLLSGTAQAVCLGMIPFGTVGTVNSFVAPKVAAVSNLLPGLSGIEDQLLMGYRNMGYLGNAMADGQSDYRSLSEFASDEYQEVSDIDALVY